MESSPNSTDHSRSNVRAILCRSAQFERRIFKAFSLPLTSPPDVIVEISASSGLENKPIATRYAVAVLVGLAGLLVREMLSPWFGPSNPYHVAWAAVAFSAWYCGVGPSIVAMLISAVGVWYWFLPPYRSFTLQDPKTQLPGLVGFLIFSGFIVAMGESTRRSKSKLQQQGAERLRTEETLHFIADRAQAGLWHWELMPDKLEWSPLCKQLFGIPENEPMSYARFLAAVHPDDREATDLANRTYLEGGSGPDYDHEYRVVWPDGTVRWIHARGSATFENGRPVRMAGIVLDVTGRRQTEEALRMAHDELEQKVAERTQALGASLATLESEVQLRRKTEQVLRELSARSLRLQDEERRRIARDLHDSTGQTLVAIKLMLDSLSRLVTGISKAPDQVRELEALADQALQEIRVTSHLLHPPLLDEVGFSSAAQWYVDGFAKRSGIKTNLELAATPSLTKDEELVFFRIVQECLTNTLRHSGSPAVDIRLSADSEYAILSITDYGKGIPEEKLKTFREIGAGVGVGLGGMKQRVRNLGGHLTVNSDGVGTCVTATLPLAKPAQSTRESDRDASPAA